MRAGRLTLIAATLVTIVAFPLLLRDALHGFQSPNAYAAPAIADQGGRVYQNGNNNDNNGNGNGNNNNSNSNSNGNSNSNVNDNNTNNNGNYNYNVNENGNGNGNDNYVPPPPPPPAPGQSLVPSSNRCFSVQETGDLRLNLTGGSVRVRAVSAAPLLQETRIRLDAVDPTTVPTPTTGATFLDTLVWQMQASSPCDGASVTSLSSGVNLSIPYTVSANKAKLVVVFLRNGVWEEVPTTPDPDPNNPFISATVRDTGTYAVIQKP